MKMIKFNYLVYKLKTKQIVAIPTDTIYGLSCLPNSKTINNLLQLKKRSKNKGLILLSSDVKYLEKFIDKKTISLLLNRYKRITRPTTFIVPSKHKLAINQTLAVRISDNKLLKYLCKKTNSAIISTSANITTKKTINSLLKLRIFFGKSVYGIVPQKNQNKASNIINLITNEVIR